MPKESLKNTLVLLIAAVVLSLFCFTPACQKSERAPAPPANSAMSPGQVNPDFNPASPESATRPPKVAVLEFEKPKVCTVQYYYRGEIRQDTSCFFERCTRENDYIIVQRVESDRMKKPVMGMRIRHNRQINAIIKEDSIIAVQDGRKLTPIIKPLDDEKWRMEILWKLDPDWHEIRIDQDLMGYFEERELVRATIKFQFDIQDGGIEWRNTQFTPIPLQLPDDGLCPE